MKSRSAIRTVACASIFVIGFVPILARAEDLPKSALANLLTGIPITAPWHIDQVAYEKAGPHWQVDIYHDPRQVTSEICVSDATTITVAKRGEEYSLEDGQETEKALALGRCDDVWKRGGNFVSVYGNITDRQLIAAVQAAFSISGYKSSSRVQFESDDLRPLLRDVTPNQIHGVDKQGSDIVLSFFAREISPDVLAIQVRNNGQGPVYIYRDNGPDIVSTEKR